PFGRPEQHFVPAQRIGPRRKFQQRRIGERDRNDDQHRNDEKRDHQPARHEKPQSRTRRHMILAHDPPTSVSRRSGARRETAQSTAMAITNSTTPSELAAPQSK